MAQQNRLDLARLNAETAQLHLRVRPPQKFQNPVRPPARHIPAAVHPAPRPTMRVRNKPLRRQPRTAQIPPRKPRTRDVKLPRNPRRNRLQASVQHIHPRVPDRTPNGRNREAAERCAHAGADRRLRWAIGIDHCAGPFAPARDHIRWRHASPATIRVVSGSSSDNSRQQRSAAGWHG